MSEVILNSQTPWACLRHPCRDLFYWIHSKCACSFYKKVLKSLGWVGCTTEDINWNESKVFSHIRDPLKKHRTGIVEYFYYNKCFSILEKNFEDDNFWKMLSRTAYLDWHSLTIWEHLGDKINRIHWIPLDIAMVDHLEASLDWIGFAGNRDKFKNMEKINVSRGFKKSCVDRLNQIDPDPLIIKYLERDQQLYDKVVRTKHFEPELYKKKLADLLSTGINQKSAELLLDQQVADGSYLSWN